MRNVARPSHRPTVISARSDARRRLIFSAVLVPMLALGCAAEPMPEEDAEVVDPSDDSWIEEQALAAPGPPEYDDPLAYVGKNRRDPIPLTTFVEEDPNSDKIILFDEREQDDFGNERWGAGYNSRLQIVGLRNASLMSTTVEGEVDTRATLFNNSFDVARISAVASASAEPQGRQEAKVKFQVYLGGKKVADSELPVGAEVVDRDLFRRNQPIGPAFSQTFLLPPGIPVKVSARALATEFIRLQGTLNAGGMEAVLTPGASLYAEASAGVGGEFWDFELSAGLRGQLTLLSATAPVTARLRWDLGPPVNNRCVPMLGIYARGELIMRELDGTLDIYAKACAPKIPLIPRFCYNPSKRISGWEAFEQRHLLFEDETVKQFSSVACGFVKPSPGVTPGGNGGGLIPTGSGGAF